MKHLCATAWLCAIPLLLPCCRSQAYEQVSMCIEQGQDDRALALAVDLARRSRDGDFRGLYRALAAKVSTREYHSSLVLAQKRDWTRAAALVDASLAAHAGNLRARPYGAQVHCLKAITAFEARDYALAEEAWRRALQIQPGHRAAGAGLPFATYNRSCEDYDAARSAFVLDTKEALVRAHDLFVSADRRTPGFLDARKMAQASHARRAELLMDEVRYFCVTADPPWPVTAHLFAVEAARLDPAVARHELFEVARDFAQHDVAAHFMVNVSSDHILSASLAGALRSQLAGRRRLGWVETDAPQAFAASWRTRLDEINGRRTRLGAEKEVVGSCPRVTFSVLLLRPRIDVRESAVNVLRSRYLHGQMAVPNPRIPELRDEIAVTTAQLAFHVATKKKREAELQQISDPLMRILANSLLTAVIGDVNTSMNKLQQKQAELATAPATVLVDDIRDYSYHEQVISKTCVQDVRILVEDPRRCLGVELEGTSVSIRSSDTRRTNVVNADIHGLRNKREVLPGDEDLVRALAASTEQACWAKVDAAINTWMGCAPGAGELERISRGLLLEEKDVLSVGASKKLEARARLQAELLKLQLPRGRYTRSPQIEFPAVQFKRVLPAEALVGDPLASLSPTRVRGR